MKILTPKIIEEKRLETCDACDKKGFAPLTNVAICTECNCPLLTKVKFFTSKCPLDRWAK
jgi:hypothetical protein